VKLSFEKKDYGLI